MKNVQVSPGDKKNGTLYTVLTFIILFITLSAFAFLLFSYLERSISDIKRVELEKKLTNTVNIESNLLANEFDSVLSDLNFLRRSYSEKLVDEQLLEDIKDDWRIFSDSRMIYDQVRFIDVSGNEIVRINYSDGNAYIVAEADLQNKKDRYYFYDAINLNEGQVFISKLDLNIENGEIEQPIKPMIRFCAPVFHDSELLGVIVLNYLAEAILNEFEHIANVTDGEMYLLNSSSYYLSSNDDNKLWAFMYDDKNDINFKSDYANEWNNIIDDENLLYSQNGLFVVSRIALEEKCSNNESITSENSIVLDDGSWIVVSHILQSALDENVIASSNSHLFKNILKKYYIYFIFIFILSLFVAFIRNITRMAKERIKFHSEYDGLTKVLNRRAGLEKLESILPSNSRRRTRTCISFIDINGLKEVNDKLGHDKGDELIITVSDVISDSIRDEDFLIRMGGDEFLIVLDNANITEAESVWERIVLTFEDINTKEDRPYIISVSHGLVDLDEGKDKDIDALIKLADEKMYSEKRRIKVDLRVIKR